MAETVKASQLIEKAKYALDQKWGYIWGGYGQIHTQKAQDNATREQTKKWGQRWVGKHVLDCSGLFYWAYKQYGGYMYHGCNTMWRSYTVDKGKLQNGMRTDGKPLKPGCPVFLTKGTDRHHVGMYIGGGMVIEAKGTYYGVVKSSVKVWDEWAEFKTTDYDVAEDGQTVQAPAEEKTEYVDESVVETVQITLSSIRNGCKGKQVKALQRLLNGNGYSCGNVDGIFGKKTHAALLEYQQANGMNADGICGQKTWSAILGA